LRTPSTAESFAVIRCAGTELGRCGLSGPWPWPPKSSQTAHNGPPQAAHAPQCSFSEADIEHSQILCVDASTGRFASAQSFDV
jgi:hypothetical protein